jgi:hypothetical protein
VIKKAPCLFAEGTYKLCKTSAAQYEDNSCESLQLGPLSNIELGGQLAMSAAPPHPALHPIAGCRANFSITIHTCHGHLHASSAAGNNRCIRPSGKCCVPYCNGSAAVGSAQLCKHGAGPSLSHCSNTLACAAAVPSPRIRSSYRLAAQPAPHLCGRLQVLGLNSLGPVVQLRPLGSAAHHHHAGTRIASAAFGCQGRDVGLDVPGQPLAPKMQELVGRQTGRQACDAMLCLAEPWN